jgi:hypothetical protein
MHIKTIAAVTFASIVAACSNGSSGDTQSGGQDLSGPAGGTANPVACTGSPAAPAPAPAAPATKKSLSCTIFVGGPGVPLTPNNDHDLEANTGGFNITIFSRVQPESPDDFSMWQAELSMADGTPVARAMGTTDSLAKFAPGAEALHFMNHSREDEVVVQCEPK